MTFKTRSDRRDVTEPVLLAGAVSRGRGRRISVLQQSYVRINFMIALRTRWPGLSRVFVTVAALSVVPLTLMAAPSATKTAEENRLDDPFALAKHALPRFEKGVVPWQFYTRYTKMMDDAVMRLSKLTPKTDTAREKQRRWMTYCKRVGAIFAAMEGHKKVMDAIDQRNTDIPEEQRPAARMKAQGELDAQVKKLSALLNDPPDGLPQILAAMYKKNPVVGGGSSGQKTSAGQK